jgi:hypothetical protein
MAVKLEWGIKRICNACTVRFYDLCHPQPTCPKCGTVAEVIAPLRTRRGKSGERESAKVISIDAFELSGEDRSLLPDTDDDILLEEDILDTDLPLSADLDPSESV